MFRNVNLERFKYSGSFGKDLPNPLLLAYAFFLSCVLLAFSASAAFAIESSEIAGVNRYETAAQQALAAYPEGNDLAIVVNSDSWADSLSATSLAGAIDCPILFCANTSLPVETSRALSELQVSEIVIIGGTGAVSSEVEAALAAIDENLSTIRVFGSDRYETQMAIYDFGKTGYDGVDHWNHDMAIVATGINYPDALSVSPLAVVEAAPLFLVDGNGLLSLEQEEALLQEGYSEILVVGGTSAVSDKTYGFLEAATMAKAAVCSVTRLGGSDRYETSSLIAEWCVDGGHLNWDGLAFASGTIPYDALAGSVLQGKKGSVLLLVGSANSASISTAVENASSIAECVFFGGTGAIAQPLRTYIEYSFKMGDMLPMGKSRIWDRSYVYCDKTGVVSEDRINYSTYIKKANNYSSATSWMILVDIDACQTIVFSGNKGEWVVEKAYICSPGAPETPTKKGTFTVGSKGLHFGEDEGYTCWYWTQFSGDYLFHSILYNPGSKTSIQDGRLGVKASHGCVRLALENAKWIYDNISSKSRVVVY